MKRYQSKNTLTVASIKKLKKKCPSGKVWMLFFFILIKLESAGSK
jgi:hypothetical protein